MIACALTSNFYLTGLVEVDYLNLAQNMKPVDDWFKQTGSDSQQESAEDILKRAAAGVLSDAKKVEISQDVMNEPVNVEVLE